MYMRQSVSKTKIKLQLSKRFTMRDPALISAYGEVMHKCMLTP